jgi:hypothetical protein
MELIRYWRIIRCRWWLPVSLLVIVGAISLATHDWSPSPVFATTFRFNVGLEPVPPPGADYVYNPLDTWMSSEYFMDDLSAAVRGAEYARRVASRLDSDVNLAGIFGSATDHRVLTVSAAWNEDSEQLARIANAAVAVLEQEAGQLVGPLGRAQPILRLIDPPVVVPVGRSLKQSLDIPIRLGLALLFGASGAFLLDYLDTSVHMQQDIEEMGIPVLGQIPRH